MVAKGRTKDESFIVTLYEMSKSSLNQNIDNNSWQDDENNIDTNISIDRYLIGQKIGLQKKAVDTICVTLAQANFIKKSGPVDIKITSNGISLAEEVIDQ